MDRIKDSGSFGPGSSPGGVTFFCGAGGSRTLVQTRNNYAFYILILLLVFVPGKETDILIQTLSP